MTGRRSLIPGRPAVQLTAAIVAISLVVACASVLVHSEVESPVIDDWTYAWSVEHLLATGRLHVLDWSIHYPLAQILWAAPFARVIGFSFATLRISTVVLAWVGLLAFFLTLRLAGRDRVTSVLGTLVLFFNPVFFVLTSSFMTDVPFVSVMSVAIALYLLWSARRSTSWLGVAGMVAFASFLIRQIGALLPLTPMAVLPGSRRAALARDVLVGGVLPLAMIGLGWWWIRSALGLTSVYVATESLRFLLSGQALWPRSWPIYAVGMLHCLLHVGLFLAPLALCTLRRTPRKSLIWSAAIVTTLVILSVVQDGRLPRLLEHGAILSLNELGASRDLIHGTAGVRALALPAMITVVGIVLVSAVVLLARFAEALRSTRLDARIVDFNTLFQFAAVEALWLYYDRYYLPLLPGLIYLLVNALDGKMSRVAMAATVLVSAGISVTGTIDNFRYNGAVVAARESLLRQGAAAAEIDAGYALNGWWLYAHPENLPAGWRPESDVAFVTTSRRLPYVVANSPLAGYSVIRIVTWSSLWAVSDHLYVLHWLPEPDGGPR